MENNSTVQNQMIRPKARSADGFMINHVDHSIEALGSEDFKGSRSRSALSSGVNVSAAKILSRFRKIFLRFVFDFPSPGSSSAVRQRDSEKFARPNTSCSSSSYSSYSHHNEAIADCIEFFNKSSEERIVEGGNSDALV